MKGIDLKQKTLQGIIWNGISKFATQGLQLITTVILARLLVPADFGLVGMAAIFAGLITIVNQTGLVAAIIQRKDLQERYLSTAFWMNLVVSGVLSLLAIVIAPLIADFFRRPVVAPMLRVLTLAFILGAMGNVHQALLQRDIDFKALAHSEVSAIFIGGVLSILMALGGFGVWSIIMGTVVSNAVLAFVLWMLCPWRPRWLLDRNGLRDLFSFGANVMSTNLINYARMNVDSLIVGRFLGSTPLGIYTMANNLATLPVRRMTSIISRVMFPALSQIQDENERMQQVYLKVVRYISLISFPFLAGVFITSDVIVGVVLGQKWLATIFPLRVLCLVGLYRAIGATVGSIFLSKGRSDIELKWNVINFFAFAIVLLIGTRFGLKGVIIGVALIHVISIPIIQAIANSLIQLSYRRLLSALWPALYSSGVMMVILGAVRLLFYGNVHPAVFLSLSTGIGIISYVGFLSVGNPKEVQGLAEVIYETFCVFFPRMLQVRWKR